MFVGLICVSENSLSFQFRLKKRFGLNFTEQESTGLKSLNGNSNSNTLGGLHLHFTVVHTETFAFC